MMKNFSNRVILLLFAGHLIFSIFSLQAQDSELTRRRIIIDGKEYYLHVIQPGEGLFSIARQYNVTQQEILDANPQLDGVLQKGQILHIPIIKGRNSSVEDLKSSDRFILHTVEKGQTVWFISQKYGVDVEDIYKYNPGARQALIVGSIIKVPVNVTRQEELLSDTEGDFIIYEIKPGDTLYSLSLKFRIPINELLEYNPGVRNGILVTGTYLRIPRKEKEGSDELAIVQPLEPSQISIKEGDFIYHEIQPGQTLYSISRRYQTDVDDIKDANPDIDPDELKPGYMLRIPRSEVNVFVDSENQEDAELFDYHKVRRKETLFSISRRYDVDMDIIQKVNPQVDFANLKKGAVLKIPTDKWFILHHPDRVGKEGEMVLLPADSLKKMGIVAPDSLCVNSEQLGSFMRPVKVALLLPFDLDATQQANIIEKIQNGDTIKTVRQNRIIARRSMVFEEFYEGVLMALDRLKEDGVNVEFKVYDIASGSKSIESFLRANEATLSEVDLIIGPARSENLKSISDFTLKHKIKLVYPLSNVNPELSRNPYLYQVNTPDTLVFDKMATEIVRQSENYNLLAVLPEEDDPYASRFMQSLRQKVFYNEFALNKKLNYVEYQISGKSDQTNLEALLDPSRKNIVVVPTNSEATISKIVPTLAGISEKNRIPIQLIGMTEWLRAQSINSEDMFQLNAQIFTFFAFDYERNFTRQFIEKYHEWFHTEPHAVSSYFQNPSTSTGYSRYGAWGFDVTYYFVSSLAQKGLHFEYCPDPVDVDLVQFNFSFKRVSNWGGFYNDGLFLLKFLPNYKVKRVPLLSIPSALQRIEMDSSPSY